MESYSTCGTTLIILMLILIMGVHNKPPVLNKYCLKMYLTTDKRKIPCPQALARLPDLFNCTYAASNIEKLGMGPGNGTIGKTASRLIVVYTLVTAKFGSI